MTKKEFKYDTADEHFLDLNERNRLQVSLVVKSGLRYLAFNKNYLDKAGNWKFGKGFWLPLEAAMDLINIIAMLAGLEVTVE